MREASDAELQKLVSNDHGIVRVPPIPAQAGIQCRMLDSRLRGNDGQAPMRQHITNATVLICSAENFGRTPRPVWLVSAIPASPPTSRT
jgi:hypothetical protein